MYEHFKRLARLVTAATCCATLLALGACGGSDDDDPAPPPARAEQTPWPGGTWTPGPIAYGSKVDSQISVTMSDGVVLKVDVSYPTDLATGTRASGTFPVLLTQTPYVFVPPTGGDFFVQRGYIYVTAYVRGTTTSGGSFSFFSERDALDGAELVMWAANQLQNSNGTVGLHGNSYMGLTQAFTIAALGPNSPVKAAQASCMGAEFYRETYFAGGVPTQTLNFQRVIGGAMAGDTAAAGAANVADIEAGGPKAYYTEFWEQRTVGNLAQKMVDAGVPVLLWSTDGDIYAQSSLDLYAYLQNAYNKQPVYGPMPASSTPTGRYQIIMSQGGHCAGQDERIQLEWFDTWLKGMDTGMVRTAMPIHVHEVVSNRWFNTSHYPVVGTYTKYYFDNGGALSASVPTNEGSESIAWAQPAAGAILQYDSPAFAQGGTLAGPISASIFASSTTTNLVLIATLSEVAPDGTATKLTTGAVLGSLRANDPARSWADANGVPTRPYGKYTADEYVPAGTIQQYDFLISPRFAAITPGNKLRVTITTQTPTADCSPVLGVDPCFPTAPQLNTLTGSTITLYHGPAHVSSINLPLLKAGCWASSDNPGIPYWNEDPALTTGPCQN